MSSVPQSSGQPACPKEPVDWVDLCLRIVVIVPLIVVYSLWLIDVGRAGIEALVATITFESR